MRSRRAGPAVLALIAMIILILDARTASLGAMEGIDICIRTVIPSLFPFLVLSAFLTEQLTAFQWKWLHPLGRILHLPQGAETILLVSFLGGYPVGAQCIRSAYDSGALSREDAQRMLCFCNNAGPAFIFGIGGQLIGNGFLCGILWGIHIIAALIIGIITAPAKGTSASAMPMRSVSFIDSVRKSIGSMAMISSWIILFRIILSYMEKWILLKLPQSLSILICGLVELSNGCVLLQHLSEPAQRFVVFSAILGFGGICVGLQTQSILSGSPLKMGPVIVGKLLHGILSRAISTICAAIIFNNVYSALKWIHLIFIGLLVLCLVCAKSKRGIAFLTTMVYNEAKSPGGITYESVPQKN